MISSKSMIKEFVKEASIGAGCAIAANGAMVAVGAGPIGTFIFGSVAVAVCCARRSGAPMVSGLVAAIGLKPRHVGVRIVKSIADYAVDIPLVRSALCGESGVALMAKIEMVHSFIGHGYANLCSFEPIATVYSGLPTQEALKASIEFLVSYSFESPVISGIVTLGVAILTLCVCGAIEKFCRGIDANEVIVALLAIGGCVVGIFIIAAGLVPISFFSGVVLVVLSRILLAGVSKIPGVCLK